MQQLFILSALLLVARVAAEHVQNEVSNVPAVPVAVQVGQEQPSHVVGHTSAVESGPQQVGAGQQFPGGPVAGFEAAQVQTVGPQFYSPAGMIQVVGQGEQQSGSFKPAAGSYQTVRHYAAAAPASGAEQYGQPESAAIPANYKPFGSWGLYIGGNPADGYYTNYYKALSGSVADKQQAVQGTAVAPAAGARVSGPQAFVGQSSGYEAGSAVPTMKQGPFYPAGQAVSYQDQSYQGYPYGEYYTPAELNSGSRVSVQSVPSVYSGVSPGFAAEQPSSGGVAMYYGAGEYAPATKKGAAQPAAFAQKEVHVPSSPAKGYHQAQQRSYYGYQQQASGAAFAPSPSTYYQQQQQQQQQQVGAAAPQVVAYPVPVGSQMVGSQPGVEGAFQPYGVHAFTRYAVKPTVVGSEQGSYYAAGVHSAPAGQFPIYRQYLGYQQPLSFYGYPLSQLHYSSGFGASQSPSGAVQQQTSFSTGIQHPAPVPPAAPAPVSAPASVPSQGATVVVEHSGPAPVVSMHSPMVPFEAASSEKSETSQKEQVNEKQQKAQSAPQQQQKSN